MFNSKAGLAAQNPTYKISRSVRLRSSATAYFSKAFGVPTSYTTSTWSFWLKGDTTTSQRFASGGNYSTSGGTNVVQVAFNTSGTFQYVVTSSNTPNVYLMAMITTPVFRDPSAWYHFVVVVDTTNATGTDRLRLYVNGVRITAFSTYTTPSLNYAGDTLFKNTTSHIGTQLINGGVTFGSTDGYLTEINFVDGQALTPSSFGALNQDNTWRPIKYTGTYGTNGFYLNFSDNSAATAATIGKDYSGNGNNWTPTNISVTAGTTYDSMLDVPTPYRDNGNGRGNYPTFNTLKKVTSNFALTNGSLQASDSSSLNAIVWATMFLPTTGKWYWEVTNVTGSGLLNVVGASPELYFNSNGTAATGFYRSNGQIQNVDGTNVTSGNSYTAGDIIGVAVDVVAGTVQFYKNGVAQGATPSFTFTAGTILAPYCAADNSVGTKTFSINFGQQPFTYTPPAGYLTLNTANLPGSDVNRSSEHFAATIYTGDGTSPRAITNTVNQLLFQPDFVWLKVRNSGSYFHMLADTVRGTGKSVNTNSSQVEQTNDVNGYVSAFNTNGFSVTSGSTSQQNVNIATSTYVSWQWKAGGTAVTNTNGSITSQVSANPTAGFSVVTYTGTGANATVGHGLYVAPKMIMVKKRNGVQSWSAYHASLANTQYLVMDSTAVVATLATMWNSTSPTSLAFSIGTDGNVNTSTATYVAYCFAEVAGYSKIGSWQNNNSTDGAFVYLGFKPRFILLKNTDATEAWYIQDSVRQTYNYGPGTSNFLNPNSAALEAGAISGANAGIDFLSNGFKIRTTNPAAGEIGFGTRNYIYLAIAEVPFKYANAR